MRDKKCFKCGETRNLVIHHINKRHYDDRLENRMRLCNFCHTAQHVKGFNKFNVGEQGLLEIEGLLIKVKVEKIKVAFGMVRYLVSPIAGTGRIFTQKIQKEKTIKKLK